VVEERKSLEIYKKFANKFISVSIGSLNGEFDED